MNDGNKGYYWGVDLFKLICAVLVVSIHTTLFYEYDALYYYFHEYLTRFAVMCYNKVVTPTPKVI